MHVIQTIASLSPTAGGTSRTIIELSRALAHEGLTTSVWTPTPQQQDSIAALVDRDIAVLSGDLRQLLSLRKPVSIIHNHGLWLPANHRVARFASRYGIPHIVAPHGMLEPWAINHRRWKKRLAWRLYQRRDLQGADALHATAATEAENLAKLGLKRPTIVIPNGIEPPDFQAPADGTGGAGADDSPHDAAAAPRTAIFLSRIHPKKGLPMLVEAWSRVRPQGWRMIVVGPDEGEHGAEVAALTRRLGVADAWEFRRQQYGEEKWRTLAAANLSILPTYSENFGNIVPESLLVGVPVITTTGAPWASLAEHRCGWWVAPTVEGIETALRAACDLPTSVLRAMGDRGRAWARQAFAWPGIARRMIAAYEAVVAGRKTPDFSTA